MDESRMSAGPSAAPCLRTRSRPAPPTPEPAGDRGDPLVVPVVVQHDEIGALRDRGDREIRDGHRPMPPPIGECPLDLDRAVEVRSDDCDPLVAEGPVAPDRPVLGAVAGAEEDLEIDDAAGR